MLRQLSMAAVLVFGLSLLVGSAWLLLLPVVENQGRGQLPAIVHQHEQVGEGDYLLGVGKADITGYISLTDCMMSHMLTFVVRWLKSI